jgi:bacterioferritin-associated ferredoxin
MYVCVCYAVTDREVREAIDSGAQTVCEVTSACRAGGDCGACRGQIEDMIEDASPCPSKRRLPVLAPSRAA